MSVEWKRLNACWCCDGWEKGVSVCDDVLFMLYRAPCRCCFFLLSSLSSSQRVLFFCLDRSFLFFLSVIWCLMIIFNVVVCCFVCLINTSLTKDFCFELDCFFLFWWDQRKKEKKRIFLFFFILEENRAPLFFFREKICSVEFISDQCQKDLLQNLYRKNVKISNWILFKETNPNRFI